MLPRQTYNGNVNADYLELVEHACTRPSMYVGTTSFEKLALFLDGYDMGYFARQGHRDGIFYPHFQHYLVAKYGKPAALRAREDRLAKRAIEGPGEFDEEMDQYDFDEDGEITPCYGNIAWFAIHMNFFKGKTDLELCGILKADFADFANPLTRMSVETK